MALAVATDDIQAWVRSLGLRNISRVPEEFAQELHPLMQKAVLERAVSKQGLKFLAYFIAYQHVAKASAITGYPEASGRKLLRRQDVRELMEDMRPLIREMLRTTVPDIEECIWKEATAYGKGSSQMGRLTALRMLMELHQVTGKQQQTKDEGDQPMGKTGVILIPTTLSIDEWNNRLIGYNGNKGTTVPAKKAENVIDITPVKVENAQENDKNPQKEAKKEIKWDD